MDETYSDMMAYLVNISKRIAGLEVDSQDIDEYIEKQNNSVNSNRDLFSARMEEMQAQMRELRKAISDMSTNVEIVVQQFKRTTRKESLDRVQRKVEQWTPEKLATYKDVRRMLGKV